MLNSREILYYPQTGNEGGQSPTEVSPSPEIWKPKFSVLTISGPSGTGKTTAARMLEKVYGIQRISTGSLFRQIVPAPVIGFAQRDLDIDRKLDQMQAEEIALATPNHPKILEGRLAGVIASKVKDAIRQEQQSRKRKRARNIVSVLIWANDPTRFRRISQREDVSLPQVRARTREREREDLKQWSQVHPQLAGRDAFDPTLTTARGTQVYDLAINTSYLTPDEVAATIHLWLRQKGLVEQQKTTANKEITVFEARKN